ncbi:hypothetical protein HanPI659440_Chr02g0081061 [Helianthus annuus]|nr:hypothetical protein HanPI659440_Chr02g0081061 [Helianthus annuus]
MFFKIITGTTGLLAAPDSGQDGFGGRDSQQMGSSLGSVSDVGQPQLATTVELVIWVGFKSRSTTVNGPGSGQQRSNKSKPG